MEKQSKDSGSSYLWVGLKCLAAVAFFGAGLRHLSADNNSINEISLTLAHRRLSEATTMLEPLMKDLEDRKKLFTESQVIKYWFEYTGPLQVRGRKKPPLFVPACMDGNEDLGHLCSSEVQSHPLLDEF